MNEQANSAEHPANTTAARRLLAREATKDRKWQLQAACINEDPELFFPIGNTGPAQLQIEEAKMVCRRCDVREQCLDWALNNEGGYGVWGGLDEDERRSLKRRRNRSG